MYFIHIHPVVVTVIGLNAEIFGGIFVNKIMK